MLVIYTSDFYARGQADILQADTMLRKRFPTILTVHRRDAP